MKTITLGKEVYVTDPCYKPSLWCCNRLSVLPGEYLADMKLNGDERPALLSVTHSDYINKRLNYKKADFYVCVDSGQAGVVDKRYYDECHTTNNFDEFYDNKLDTWILADVDATDEEKAVAKELYDMNKQIADAFNENNIKTAREIIKKQRDYQDKHPWFDYIEIVKTGKTKKFIANLGTPDNKGAFTITSHGGGSYKVRLAKNKEGEIVSILIIYD